MTSIPAKNSI